MKSEQINELAAAMAKAQGEIKGAVKDSENPFFKSSYADLSSVWDACRTALSKNGLCVVQTTDRVEQGIDLVTTLAHSSGQWLSSRMPVLAKDNSPQALGSAITYARRYALAALVGVAQVDDDGEGAMKREAPKQPDATQARTTTTREPLIKNVTQVNGSWPRGGA